MSPEFLTARQLAERWCGLFSVRTIRNWRYVTPTRGPSSERRGSRVVYLMADIEAFEAFGALKRVGAA